MNISSILLKMALKDYDDQAGRTSFARARAFGEYPLVVALRRICANFKTDRNLTPDECISLITLLIDTEEAKNKRHDELLLKLKDIIGEDKLLAFARLRTKGLLTEYIDEVESHNNPQSAARMITHFTKFKKESLQGIDLNDYLSKEDPYTSLKTMTSTAMALQFLKNANLETANNNSLIEAYPIHLAKAIKKLKVNEVLITDEIFNTIAEHKSPVGMAIAIIELNKCLRISIHNELKEELIEQAKKHIAPEGFAKGIIVLEEAKLYTEDNRNILVQSASPLDSAHLLILEKGKEQLKSMGTVSYAITSGLLSFNTGTYQDPLNVIELKEKEIKDNLEKNYTL